jgi:hypothetical protein
MGARNHPISPARPQNGVAPSQLSNQLPAATNDAPPQSQRQDPRTRTRPRNQCQPTRPTDPHSRSPQSLIAPRRESLSRSQQRRVAPGHTKWGSRGRGATHEREGHPRTHSPRHDRHPHLPFAVNGLGRTLSFARKSAESESCEVERRVVNLGDGKRSLHLRARYAHDNYLWKSNLYAALQSPL